jgi:3-deoxy-D-manno-octulosonic-acid transferase
MPFALNFIYIATLFLYAPVLLYRMIKSAKYRDGLWEKFWGKAPIRIGERPCLWFHAVSVGEVRLLRPLVHEMARRRPNWEIVISTTTTTGLAIARQAFPDLITFYAPLDFSWATGRAIGRVRPTVLALIELELWPNLIRSAKRSGAKVAIINARLSARSYRGYRSIKGPLGPTLRCIDVVAAQDADYARRFVELGVPEERVSITGSVKYDGLESDRNNANTRKLRQDLGLSHADLIFVAGSTMDGEEAAALAAYRAARLQHPGLRLILVPRHPERFDRVAEWLVRNGERVIRRSQTGTAAAAVEQGGGPPPVILIDTIGELAAVWGLADVAFVGGSLVPGRGGQNMMEPAAYGASVLFGPHTANFRETVEQLLTRNAARRVADAQELTLRLREDLDDPEAATARGTAGRTFVLAQHGASGRTLAELDRLVDATFTQKSA